MTPRSTRRPQSAQMISMWLTAVESGTELKPAPPRPRRRLSGHAFEGSLAFGEVVDAEEAHADLLVRRQSKQARPYPPVAAAPTAGVGWLDEVAADSSSIHDQNLIRAVRGDALRSRRSANNCR